MELRILSPTAILGYGFPQESLEAALREGFDAIGVDGGSTDPGPYYLGEGVPFTSEAGVERDTRLLLKASREAGVPLIITTAGGAGARPHVEWMLGILYRIASSESLSLRVAVVWSDVSPERVLELMDERGLEPADPGAPEPRPETIKASRVVAQAGLEPVIEALKAWEPDVVLAGRAVDVAAFAALPVMRGMDLGLSIHMAKILECGAIAAEPGSGSDSMMGVIRPGEFIVYPLNPSRRATVASIAEHALYERPTPYNEHVPGGYVDLSNATYEQIDDRTVRVKGSRWVQLDSYKVKLEGSRPVGYRYLTIAGARDPGFIAELERLIGETRRILEGQLPEYRGKYRLIFRVYGRDAVMGPWEPTPRPGHEVGIVIEAVSESREIARDIVAQARSVLLHIGWPGRRSTAGNLAFPFSPSDFYGGRVYEWSLWHLVTLRDPLELFKLELWELKPSYKAPVEVYGGATGHG